MGEGLVKLSHVQ